MKKKLFIGVVAIWGILGGFGGLMNAGMEAFAVRIEASADVDVGADADVGVDASADAELPEIYLKAVNPGYTVDGVSNVGEMVEISRRGSSNELISLAGLMIDYTNSSGKHTTLVEFPEHAYMAGEKILLRLASSPESELAAMTYNKTLAFKGAITLKRGEEVVDEMCWNGGEGCAREFKSKEPTVLVRGDGGEVSHILVGEYVVEYEPEAMKMIAPEVEAAGPDDDDGDDSLDEDGRGAAEVVPQCREVEFSEVLSYYEEMQDEQFIELHNAGAEQVLLDGCGLRYKNKIYPLEGVLKADGYLVRRLTDFRLAKNPSNEGVVELLDVDGEVVDTLKYPNGQKKGTAYALIGYNESGNEIWKTTFAVTPGEENNYQEYKSCEAGKVINPETGNCVKVTEVEEKVCESGYYLNEATGRCKKIPVEEEKVCKEGYYLNEATGRCRKIVENDGANYEIEPEQYEEKTSFVGLIAVLVVVGLVVIYVIYEFRHEIKRKLKFFKR